MSSYGLIEFGAVSYLLSCASNQQLYNYVTLLISCMNNCNMQMAFIVLNIVHTVNFYLVILYWFHIYRQVFYSEIFRLFSSSFKMKKPLLFTCF